MFYKLLLFYKHGYDEFKWQIITHFHEIRSDLWHGHHPKKILTYLDVRQFYTITILLQSISNQISKMFRKENKSAAKRTILEKIVRLFVSKVNPDRRNIYSKKIKRLLPTISSFFRRRSWPDPPPLNQGCPSTFALCNCQKMHVLGCADPWDLI